LQRNVGDFVAAYVRITEQRFCLASCSPSATGSVMPRNSVLPLHDAKQAMHEPAERQTNVGECVERQ
jgi:hypothetical protein